MLENVKGWSPLVVRVGTKGGQELNTIILFAKIAIQSKREFIARLVINTIIIK